MGRVVLRSVLANRVRRHAGQETLGQSANRLFIDPAELDELLDDAARELDGLLVTAQGEDYAAKTVKLTSMTTVDGQIGFDLPQDFFYLLSIRLDEGGVWRELGRFHPTDVARLRNAANRGTFEALHYRVSGSNADDADPVNRDRIVLEPVPTSAPSIEVTYVPVLVFESNSANVAYRGINGWESYIVYSVVADVLAKGEQDPSYWLGKKSAIKGRIARLAGSRDSSKPASIVLKPLGRRARIGRGFGYG